MASESVVSQTLLSFDSMVQMTLLSLDLAVSTTRELGGVSILLTYSANDTERFQWCQQHCCVMTQQYLQQYETENALPAICRNILG
jgi:hypothetical protein